MIKDTKDNKNLLLQYSGLAFQFLAVIGAAVFIGYWVDKKMAIKFPLLIWLLPLLAIIGMIIKVVKDTSIKK
jgi:hypothetical protein